MDPTFAHQSKDQLVMSMGAIAALLTVSISCFVAGLTLWIRSTLEFLDASLDLDYDLDLLLTKKPLSCDLCMSWWISFITHATIFLCVPDPVVRGACVLSCFGTIPGGMFVLKSARS